MLTSLRTRVPPPALTPSGAAPLSTATHGHACLPGAAGAPYLHVTDASSPAAQRHAEIAAAPGPPTCADAARPSRILLPEQVRSFWPLTYFH